MRQKQNGIVILGGGYGGAMAAARLARRGVSVTLIDANDALVERIRMHQVAAGDDVAPISFARLFRGLPVRVLQARVTAIDRARQRVLTSAGEVAYDRLVYALGSRSAAPPSSLTLNDPRAVREHLRDAKSVSVVGGGLTGIELASELAERFPNLAVKLFDAGEIGKGLSPRARQHLHEWMAAHNVTLRENTRVESLEGLVLWCGSFAVSDIAHDAGLAVNARGQIVVDDHLRSSDPSIFAIGDAAQFRDRRMSCALALPMGAYVADFLGGATSEPFRFAFALQCISLGRRDGIIQFVNADDSPRDSAITGRPAAWIKELVCRYTVLSLGLERRGVHYRWPQTEAA